MIAYQMNLIEYLKYRITCEGLDLGIIEVSDTDEIGFTYYNELVRGYSVEIKDAVHALRASKLQ